MYDQRDGFSVLIRLSLLSDAHSSAKLNNEGRTSVFRSFAVSTLMSHWDSAEARMCFSKTLRRTWLRTNDLSMRIRSYTEIENLNSRARISFSSEREVEGRSPRQVRSWRAPHPFGIVIRNVSARKTTVERVDSRDWSQRDLYFIRTHDRESAWKKSPGDAERAKLFPSLSIFLETHFSRTSRYYLKRADVKICVIVCGLCTQRRAQSVGIDIWEYPWKWQTQKAPALKARVMHM